MDEQEFSFVSVFNEVPNNLVNIINLLIAYSYILSIISENCFVYP